MLWFEESSGEQSETDKILDGEKCCILRKMSTEHLKHNRESCYMHTKSQTSEGMYLGFLKKILNKDKYKKKSNILRKTTQIILWSFELLDLRFVNIKLMLISNVDKSKTLTCVPLRTGL